MFIREKLLDFLRWHRNRSRLRWGYFPDLSKRTENIPIIQTPSEYTGCEFLKIACTQTSLTPYAQRKLVTQWCEVLPNLPVKSIAFLSRANQSLFEAATNNLRIQSLYVKWGPVSSLATLRGHPNIEAIYLGSCPNTHELKALHTAKKLRYLFLDSVPNDLDYSLFKELTQLKELGLALPRGKWKKLDDLEFLSTLSELEVLWLVGIKVPNLGMSPLARLPNLVSVRASWGEKSQEMNFITKELKRIKYREPVFH